MAGNGKAFSILSCDINSTTLKVWQYSPFYSCHSLISTVRLESVLTHVLTKTSIITPKSLKWDEN